MTMREKTRWRAGGIVAVAAVCAAAFAAVVPRTGDVHEIRMVVRNMAYHVEGEPAANPTLRVRAGERVRVVLRNEDPGMIHDVGIASWRTRTAGVKAGDEARLEFTVPDGAGQAEYACTPHGQVMRGRIIVE